MKPPDRLPAKVLVILFFYMYADHLSARPIAVAGSRCTTQQQANQVLHNFLDAGLIRSDSLAAPTNTTTTTTTNRRKNVEFKTTGVKEISMRHSPRNQWCALRRRLLK